jgi:hypothetical protein
MPTDRSALDVAFWSIVEGIESCPPHLWSCPKVMKLNPEHAAWTCERCGAIAITDGPELRPAA